MYKHLKITCFLLILHSQSGISQFEFGLKAGMSSYELANNTLSVVQGNERLDWTIKTARYGHHFGVYSRVKILALYFEPALMFHTNAMTYTLEEYSNQQQISKTIRNATYRHLDIPAILGLKMGFFRLQTGAVGHFFINELSDLTETSGYSKKLDDATISWLAGAGIDVWRLRLDVNYEGPMHVFGESISVAGQTLEFSKNPGRILLTLGFKL